MDDETAIPGEDLAILFQRDLNLRVKELPDGSWEWIYYGDSHRGRRFHFSDRFARDMHTYFTGEEWLVYLAKQGQRKRQVHDNDVRDYFAQRNNAGERIADD